MQGLESRSNLNDGSIPHPTLFSQIHYHTQTLNLLLTPKPIVINIQLFWIVKINYCMLLRVANCLYDIGNRLHVNETGDGLHLTSIWRYILFS